MAKDKWITAKAVGEMTGFAVKSIYMRTGSLKTLPAPKKFGRNVRWSQKEVERWISDKPRKRRASADVSNVVEMPPPGSRPPTLSRGAVTAIVSTFRKPISPASTGDDDCPTLSEDQERLVS